MVMTKNHPQSSHEWRHGYNSFHRGEYRCPFEGTLGTDWRTGWNYAYRETLEAALRDGAHPPELNALRMFHKRRMLQRDGVAWSNFSTPPTQEPQHHHGDD